MKNLLKKTIKGVLGEKSKPYVYLYYNFYHKSTFPSMDHFVNAYADVKSDVFFVQVGANEGSTEDPLYRQIRLKKLERDSYRNLYVMSIKHYRKTIKIVLI